MKNLQHYIYEVDDLKKEADEVSSQWNGDESGRLEERATIAAEISTKAIELQTLLEELKDF